MIIDAHAHIFPDKIAEKATAGISAFYGNLPTDSGGTVSELLQKGASAGVDMFLVQSVATVPLQVVTINNFIAECCKNYPDKFIGFGAMHPNFPNIPAETERLISLGLRGVKLHSDFQNFRIDDECAYPIYKACEGRLPILFHCGDPRSDGSSPERLLNVVRKFPRLTVIAAHFAGWTFWNGKAERFAEYLSQHKDAKIYTDCSSSLFAMTPTRAAELIRTFGAERVFWGTDYPIWNAGEELARFREIPLTERERGQILGENLMKMLSADRE